jgi:hypothetical protein
MRNFAIATGAAGALAAVAFGLAGAAAAAPAGPGSAGDVVKSLQDQGYNVQLNGASSGPLSECTVTGIHPTGSTPADGSGRVTQFSTVYVDISCPPSNN